MKTALIAALLLAVTSAQAATLRECTFEEPHLKDWDKPWKCMLSLPRYQVCVRKWKNALNHGNETLDHNCGPVPRAARKLYEESKDLPPLDNEEAWELIRKQSEPTMSEKQK
jgi:hypothetical protein